ncbi:MAG TPA: DUF72 domain-containing protein [Polyangiaceae bacterium]|nr:DUF72 domain-containing protein [Polyangiaceae bacterium]
MRAFVGTSGFSYKEWRGSFYPEKMPERQMLEFYSQRLPAVEINNTFYRMPRDSLLSGWCTQVPQSFRFILKASQKITHIGRLGDLDSLAYFLKTSEVLGERRGPILFQLPPFFRQDLERLRAFLEALQGTQALAAFEFRHPSWFEPDTLELLKAHGAALCGGDVDEEGRSPPLHRTADFGYLRLRRSAYTDSEITDWAKRIVEQKWQEAYVFFKHEEQGPQLAAQLIAEIEKLS